jgi:uncharacterized protein
MYINQNLLETVFAQTDHNKVLIIYGPRQVGKTTLLHKLLEKKHNYLLVNGEDIDVQHYLSSQSISKLKDFIGNHNLLVIDEAQKIPNIGINLKLLIDNLPNLQIIATGSSAFELANYIGEPLVGRKLTFQMFPLAQLELNSIENLAETRANIEARLLYGSYPKVILETGDEAKKRYLKELINSYLYKDILELEGIRKAKTIVKLLQLLAFQIGSEVSLAELGQQVGLNKATVERYLDILEKSFILVNISGFSRNLRKAVTKKARYFFYDVGVRNAVINQFAPLAMRNDVGELWENYIIIERLKKQAYKNIWANNYFLRTYDQQEIDWLEERDGKLFAYEIKWQAPGKKIKLPTGLREAYPDIEFFVIHRDNYLDFIT